MMDWSILIEKSILVVILFAISLAIAAYSTYAERKIAAFLQDRIGPDRAGPWGLLQPLADGGKMFFKEEIITNGSHKLPEWWSRLGNVLNSNDEINWSIDGWDQVSNEKYRINSNWQSIEDGIRSFTTANSSISQTPLTQANSLFASVSSFFS